MNARKLEKAHSMFRLKREFDIRFSIFSQILIFYYNTDFRVKLTTPGRAEPPPFTPLDFDALELVIAVVINPVNLKF